MSRVDFWKDKANEVVDPKLFSDTAEGLARQLAKANEQSRGKHNKRTQIRKFYDEVLRLENEAQVHPEKWAVVLPRVHMLTAKAAYAQGRELVSKDFLDFVKSSVNQIEGSKDLSVWANFFEAFMGFYRLHGPRS